MGKFLVSRTGDDTLRVLCCVLCVVCGVQCVPFRINHSDRESSETSSLHCRTRTWKARCPYKRKSSRDSNVVREPYSERERILSELKISVISLNFELIKLLEERKLLHPDYLRQNIIRRMALKDETDYLLPIRAEYAGLKERKYGVSSS